MKDYFNEARERWGDTDAYREHTKNKALYKREVGGSVRYV